MIVGRSVDGGCGGADLHLHYLHRVYIPQPQPHFTINRSHPKPQLIEHNSQQYPQPSPQYTSGQGPARADTRMSHERTRVAAATVVHMRYARRHEYGPDNSITPQT